MPRRNELVHKGIRYNSRTTIDDALGRREKVFADAWIEANEPKRYFSCSSLTCSRLEMLMVEGDQPIPVSQGTATAVATIIQWLASPIGFSFLEQTLRTAGYRITSTQR